ncbi:MAG: LPS-assembly protein LptD, partial [Azonexus sp.]|nr:LPS-assembly protein LptD [Azonexus sp.]
GLPTEAPAERPSTASGSAERIDLAGENHFLFDRATFSTCKPGSTDWYLQASKMDLDFDKDFGSADHASVWFQGAPLFYTPKIWFPLNNRRRSGLLAPTFKQSTKSGFDFTQPYYWNIAPNYDATFYPRYMSKRGTQLGAEIRYLGEGMESEVRGEYLGNDKKFLDRSRYGYSVRHRQNLADGLSAYVNWNGVSDDWYWEDMSSRLLQTSQVQLERQLTLGYTPAPWLSSSLQILRYQTLQPDPKNLIARPYFLEPQLNLSGYKTNLLGALDFTLLGQYSRFTHDDRDNKAVGDRLVFYPQLSWPVVASAFRLQPKIGMHMSSYAVDEARINGGKRENFSRVLPTFSFDSTLILEREDELLGNAYIQTLEPRLYYVYIPYKKQDHIPVFDTGISDFDFAQIFSENRYVGYDRVNDAHQLTAALTTRILDADTGAERFKAMLGQRYYFARQRVQLPGEAQRPANFSNLVASITGLVAPKTYAEGTWEYNYKDRINERFSAGVRFQPDYGKVLSASYRYTRDPLNQKGLVDQVDISGQWPLAPRWYGVGRVNYSLRDKQTLETIAGLEYNAGCWAVRAVAQRLSATSGAPDTSFFLQLELQDFASVGSNPLSLLRRSIPGYGKTNELAPDSF